MSWKRRLGSGRMAEQNVDPKVLAALYGEYLNRSIQLTEGVASLRVRVAELEEALKAEETPAGVDDAAERFTVSAPLGGALGEGRRPHVYGGGGRVRCARFPAEVAAAGDEPGPAGGVGFVHADQPGRGARGVPRPVPLRVCGVAVHVRRCGYLWGGDSPPGRHGPEPCVGRRHVRGGR